ncbi:hypothetical protein HDU92_007844 [Lobulomyces angularis]|nr:hypothetical protein HDU92_007844 [Lobulomyces angularis]
MSDSRSQISRPFNFKFNYHIGYHLPTYFIIILLIAANVILHLCFGPYIRKEFQLTDVIISYNYIPYSIIPSYVVYLTLTYAQLVNSFVTHFLKISVGELRPDFLDRCKPEGWKTPNATLVSYFPTPFLNCTGDPGVIKEGRLSFPSGHARIQQNIHHPIDVVSGVLIGVVIGYISFYFGFIHLSVCEIKSHEDLENQQEEC